MKILVVDDDRLLLRIAADYLQTYFPDYSIEVCQHPKQVMDILKKDAIDIVLLDIIMPEVSGIELLQNIRANARYKDLQVLMVTSMNDTENFKKCFELGANDYIRKPIEIIEFQARIRAAAKTRANLLELHDLYEKMKLQNEELKEVNSKLKDTQFFLIQSEKLAAIGELAAGVAHEINNPIGYVGSNMETMSNYLRKMQDYISFVQEQMTAQTEDVYIMIQEKYHKNKLDFVMEDLAGVIKDSQDGIQKVAEIVKSLRNFARTGMEDEKNFSSLEEIIGQVLLIVRNEAKYSVDINVNQFDIPPVYGNRSQIGQVLLNIIMNAIQAIKSQKRAEKGNINIFIQVEEEYACISIKDDGPGISQENLSKIFNPFFTTKEVGQGTGLGLSISHDIIVKKHNGILDVKSVIGEGTEFIIKLPLEQK
jgi:Signal transduction histidine kinase regulating C4-dicarboxylate transport system